MFLCAHQYQQTHDTQHTTPNTRHPTHDIQHTTHNTCPPPPPHRCYFLCSIDDCGCHDTAEVPNQHRCIWDLWICEQLDLGMYLLRIFVLHVVFHISTNKEQVPRVVHVFSLRTMGVINKHTHTHIYTPMSSRSFHCTHPTPPGCGHQRPTVQHAQCPHHVETGHGWRPGICL